MNGLQQQKKMSIEVERAECTDYGEFAINIAEATQDDPTGILDGRIVDFYNTITSTGFVIERNGERYDVRVSKAL